MYNLRSSSPHFFLSAYCHPSLQRRDRRVHRHRRRAIVPIVHTELLRLRRRVLIHLVILVLPPVMVRVWLLAVLRRWGRLLVVVRGGRAAIHGREARAWRLVL